jgi:hypothetical protein
MAKVPVEVVRVGLAPGGAPATFEAPQERRQAVGRGGWTRDVDLPFRPDRQSKCRNSGFRLHKSSLAVDGGVMDPTVNRLLRVLGKYPLLSPRATPESKRKPVGWGGVPKIL